MLQSLIEKNDSSTAFGSVTDFYHQHATVQKEVAERLSASLDPWKETLPDGPIIELGCGTGFLSEGILRLFADRKIIFSDVSKGMLEACRDNIGSHKRIHFKELNAEKVPVEEPAYAMTISSFAAQWFLHPAYTLAQWLEVTKPGGLLLAAFPGNKSFPEWKKNAEECGLPFTANSLPDTEEMVVNLSSDFTQVDYYEDTITQNFSSSADFFRHLKNLGAGTQLSGRHLTSQEMKLLIDHWDGQSAEDITVSWHVVFLAVKKNPE